MVTFVSRLSTMTTASLCTFLAICCLQPSLASSTINQLKGVHFRVSAFQVSGYLSMEMGPNGTYTYKGILKDLYDWIFSERHGISYHFVNVNLTNVATRGLVQANIDLLLNNEVDLCSLGFVPTAQRLLFMDFTYPTSVEQYRFLVPYPKEKSRLWGPVRPFQTNVWLLFFGTMFIIILTLSYLANRSQRKIKTTNTFSTHLSDSVVFVLTILISNAEYFRDKALSTRIVLSVWCLMCVIIINAYTGNLTSYLTYPATQPIPNSFEELAAREDMSIIVEYNSVLAQQILGASSGAFKVLGDSLRRNPNHLFKTIQQSDSLMTTQRVVYPGFSFINLMLVWKNLQNTGQCNITVSKPLPLYRSISAGLPKHGPHNEAINAKILVMWEIGLLKHLEKKHIPNVENCFVGNKEKPNISRLKLVDFKSAFVIWASGIGLSTFVFLVEKLSQAMKATLKK